MQGKLRRLADVGLHSDSVCALTPSGCSDLEAADIEAAAARAEAKCFRFSPGHSEEPLAGLSHT